MKIDEDLEIKIINKEGALTGASLLEIGCGDGRLSFYLANLVKRIVAIDPSADEIRKAQKRLYPSIKNLRFLIGKGNHLNFKDNSFDRILFSLSFHHIPFRDHTSAIKESFRVLDNKGKLLIYEPLKEGEMQSLFLIFEEESKEMDQVYETISQSEEKGLFKKISEMKFRITWRFDDFQELADYFADLYGKEKVKDNLKKVRYILNNKLKDKPLVINDDLIIIVMKVNK